MNKASISFGYFMGLLNSDGSFFITLKEDSSMTLNYRLVPVIQISQKKERAFILEACQTLLLNSNGIKGQIKDKSTPNSENIKNQQRSCALEISGLENVKKLLNLIENSGLTLFGLKYYDYLLFQELYLLIKEKKHLDLAWRGFIIDLKYQFHVPVPLDNGLLTHYKNLGIPEREIKELPSSNRLDRASWEERHGLAPQTSVNASQAACLRSQELCRKQALEIQANRLSIDGSQVSGIIDGNGHIDENNNLGVTFITGNESLFNALSNYFQDNSPRFYGTRGSVIYKLTRVEMRTNLLSHLEKYPLL